MNKIILHGRLTAAPERVKIGEKNAIKFSVADNSAKNTSFFDVVSTNEKHIELAEKYLSKASEIIVDGMMTISDYTKKDGTVVKQLTIWMNSFSFCGTANK